MTISQNATASQKATARCTCERCTCNPCRCGASETEPRSQTKRAGCGCAEACRCEAPCSCATGCCS
jgi:hypothetical protein